MHDAATHLNKKVKMISNIQGWTLQNNSACPSEMCLKDLPVRHNFLPVFDSKYKIKYNKCQNFTLSFGQVSKNAPLTTGLPVHLYFYLSRTGEQSLISIPEYIDDDPCEYLLH